MLLICSSYAKSGFHLVQTMQGQTQSTFSFGVLRMFLGVGDSPGLIQCLSLLLGSTMLLGGILKSQVFESLRAVKIPMVHFFVRWALLKSAVLDKFQLWIIYACLSDLQKIKCRWFYSLLPALGLDPGAPDDSEAQRPTNTTAKYSVLWMKVRDLSCSLGTTKS